MFYLTGPEPTVGAIEQWRLAGASNHVEQAIFHRFTEQLAEQLEPVQRATEQLIAAIAPYAAAKAKADAAGLNVSHWTLRHVIEWARQQEDDK